MNLSGRLAATTLGDLLGTLHRARASGTLELTEDAGPVAGRVHRLRFDAGLLHFVESTLGAPRLGEMLVAKGYISHLQQIELLSYQECALGKSTGKCLIELQWVSSDLIRETIREQLIGRLSALYQLRNARVTYRVIRPQLQGIVPNEPLTVKEFLHGRPRTRDRKPAEDSSSHASDSPKIVMNPSDPMRRRALLLLGLEPHADTTDVKRAFRRMAAKLHPDRHLVAPLRQQELVRQRFSQVTEAYHLLTG